MNMPLTFDALLGGRIADLDEQIAQAKLYLKKLKAYRRYLARIQSELVAIAEIEANMPPAPPSNDFVADMEKLVNGEAAIDNLMDKYRDNADNHTATADDDSAATNGLVVDLEQAIAENRRNYAELLSITTDLASTLAHQYDTEGDVPEPTEATDTPVTQIVREAFEVSNQNYCNLLNLSTELAETATELAAAEVRRLAPSGEVIDVEVDVHSTEADAKDADLLSQYQSMGIRALRLLCRDKGIKGAARFTKAQCIAALLEN